MFTICLPLILLPKVIRAQDYSIPQVFSPTAAELGKYGKIPVSYYNGLPNIKIDLTELKGKDYSLPVYLTYHAGGNKPEHHPGWVGLGWALHAGGCINRIVRGAKDEESIEEYAHNNGIGLTDPPGYLFHAAECQTLDWDDDDILAGAFNAPMKFKDYEPDEFMVNLDGLQASFYITGENEIKITSQSDVYFTVSYVLATNNDQHTIVLYTPTRANDSDSVEVPLFGYIKTIYLTTDDGTKYTFGGDTDAIEFSMFHTPHYSYNLYGYVMHADDYGRWNSVANTWNLTSIERPNGEIISFEYRREGVPISVVDTHYQYYFNRPNAPLVSTSIGSGEFNLNMNYTFLYPSYLKKISSYRGGDEMTFQISMTQELGYNINRNTFKSRVKHPDDAIDVFLSENYYCKLNKIITRRGIVNFEYTTSDTTRLKLLGVSISDSTSPVKRYSMEYNQEPLPSYNSRKTDSWGYYSRTTPYTLSPTTTFNTTRRQVSAQLMQAEMLTKLTYPTGGYTTFEYEPHTFSQVANSFPFILNQESGTAGGLRIKRIIDHSLSGTGETRNFLYSINGQSSGILAGYPSFYETGSHSVSIHVGGWLGFLAYYHYDEEFDAPYSCFSEQTLTQLSTTYGCNVTYSNVTEERPGGGRTEYVYYNHDSTDINRMDRGSENMATTMINSEDNIALLNPISSFELSRGLLRSRRDYNKAGRLVREEENTYSLDTLQFVKSVSRLNLFNYLLRASYYKHYSCFPALEKKMVYEYPDVGTVPYTEEYRYVHDNYRNVKRAFKRVWGHGIDETRVVYCGDESLDGPSSVYAQMKAAGILDRPVEILHLRDNQIISAELTTYRKEGSLFVPGKEYKSNLEEPVEPLQWVFYHSGSSIPQHYGNPARQYLQYDTLCNPLRVLDGATRGTQIKWSADGVHPVASFHGAGPRIQMTPTYGEASKHQSLRGTTGRCVLVVFNSEVEGAAELNMWFDEGESVNCYVKLDTSATYYYHPQNNSLPSGGHDSFFYTVQNVPPGRHAFQIALTTEDFLTEIPDMIPLDPVGPRYFQADANILYLVETYSESIVSQPTFYEDFETDGNYSGGFESEKAQFGIYPVALSIPIDVPYRIDWMEKTQGSWHYRSASFTGQKFLGQGVSAIDNIRVYPAGASAQSWTWWPSGLLRSETSESGETIRYRYDGLGRLTKVLDKDGNSRTAYQYEYDNDSHFSTVRNIIRNVQYTTAGANPSSQITEQWHDGLGRPSAIILKEASPVSGGDLKETIQYDSMGRKVRESLPVPSSNSSFYGSQEEPYSVTEYDDSPLDRPVAEFGPGKAWHDAGKAVRTRRLVNDILSDTLKCYKWNVSWQSDTTAIIQRNGYCQMGTLRAQYTSDEDGHTLVTFTDMRDKTVLERKLTRSFSGALSCVDTYYVYDDFGRLAAVLPPKLSSSLGSSSQSSWNSNSSTDIKRYAYLYRYNPGGLCIAKKLPGCGWTLMVYDRDERMVLTQNAIQRKTGLWDYVFHDEQGRECITGYKRDQDLNAFEYPLSNIPVVANRTSSGVYGYKVEGMSVQPISVYNVTWWDDYRFLGQWGVPQETAPCIARTAPEPEMTSYGRPTGNLSIVLGGPTVLNYLWTVHYYDDFGREVQSNAEYLQGVEKEAWSFDFAGNVTGRSLTHMNSEGATVLSENYTYGYDSWNRPTTTSHHLGTNGPDVSLSINTYDAVGRLTGRQRASCAALTETMGYNVRSWLDSVSVGANGETFMQLFFYNSQNPRLSNVPCWSGNISSLNWSSGSSGTSSFKYTYDGLSRLVSSTYKPSSGSNVHTSWNYDRNGNILGEGGTVSYTLNGNRTIGKTMSLIEEIIDPGPFIPDPFVPELEPEPYIAGPVTTDTLQHISLDSLLVEPLVPDELSYSYTYDVKGRMISDTERGISEIRYNILDLPSRVVPQNVSVPTYYYLYSSDGRKLQQGVYERPTSPRPGLIGEDNYIPHMTYQGNLVYVDGVLDRILFDGGYISASDSVYHFFITDHLGSVRVVAEADGTIEKCYDYEPYGRDLGSSVAPDSPTPNPYKFGGKEYDQVLGNYNFSARLFNHNIGRWTTMDPLCEKYYSISPYTYCAANPVNRIDPNGMDWYIFDETGNYSQTIEHEGQHRLAVRTENEEGFSYRFYDFADPKNDPKDIDEHVINKLEFVSTEDVVRALNGAGTFEDNMMGIIDSGGGGRYDFFTQQIATDYNYDQKLYIVEGIDVAHNAQNYGNFLWGAAGASLKIPPMLLLLAAQINSRFDPFKANGYPKQWDSIDDQKSIFWGTFFARKHKL